MTRCIPLTLLSLVAFAGWGWGCSNTDERSSRTKDQQDSKEKNETSDEPGADDKGTDEPAWVNSLFLNLDCKSETNNEDAGRYTMLCEIQDKTGKSVSPETFSNTYGWEVHGGPDVTIDVEEMTNKDQYAARITIGANAYIALSVLQKLEVRFHYVDNATHQSNVINKRLDLIYAGLANKNYFRISLNSIRDHNPAEPLESITSLEFKIDGNWERLTLDHSTKTLFIGSYVVEAEPLPSDYLMFANIFGLNNPALRATAFTRYNANDSFDATTPLQLVFGDQTPKSITGIRYNGGSPLSSTNVPAGFPDKFVFESSADKTNWTEVPGSRTDIESIQDADILQYIWTGSEVPSGP